MSKILSCIYCGNDLTETRFSGNICEQCGLVYRDVIEIGSHRRSVAIYKMKMMFVEKIEMEENNGK